MGESNALKRVSNLSSNFTNIATKAIKLTCLAASLAGCAGQTDETPAPEPEPVAVEKPSIAPEELERLLRAAQQAVAKEHLTFPKRGSAMEIYTQILDLEPEQEDALRGLEHIVERYVALAMSALEREQYATARSMLTRGRLILPDHPSIEPTAAQIRLLQEAERTRLSLSPKLLRNEQALTDQLSNLLARPAHGELSSCRFKIWAGSDRAGREIYQSLSRAYAASLGTSPDETPRLKAQLAVRSPNAVERICFKPS